MNSEFIPTLDGCLDELLRNEQQFITRSSLEQHQSQVAPVSVAYVSQGKFKPRDISSLQCHSCKVFGHIILECHKKVWNYCKKDGHVIKECRTHSSCKTEAGYVATATLASSSALPTAPT